MNIIKISIIVPIYNVENYIKRCMDSLVAQEFDDYEIIAVNDGTLDNSMAYVYELQRKYHNIIICEQENIVYDFTIPIVKRLTKYINMPQCFGALLNCILTIVLICAIVYIRDKMMGLNKK